MTHTCRQCRRELTQVFCDLGNTPLANSILRTDKDTQAETSYPLCAFVCSHCFLVQLPAVTSRENIFVEYSYFSSFSESWLTASREYAEETIKGFGLNRNSLVVEVGSNDGYLLQYFQRKGIQVLGIEPAQNVASTAIQRGIPTRTDFFGVATAKQLLAENIHADHIAVKNVLAHVPDLHDFIEGMKLLLKADGILSVEFPHLLRLIRENQFDTIYHEHFCYFSLLVVEAAFSQHGLKLFDVQELPTHGGSLRVWACHSDSTRPVNMSIARMRRTEKRSGLEEIATYSNFKSSVNQVRDELTAFLHKQKQNGKTIAAYGAPAKGNTLLNYCRIGKETIDFTVDKNPYKQGCLLPGTHIPIYAPEHLSKTKPDFIVILPWNLKDEILHETAYASRWGAQYVVPIPKLEVITLNPNAISQNAA